jgi:hypothetical protein
MLRIATEDYFKSLEQFLSHLPPGRDEELLVLKGHLLVERLVARYLRSRLPNPEQLEKVGLRFAQKVAVASAMSSEADEAWLWQAIFLLNQLRNELAHDLDKPRHAALLARFLTVVEKSPELPELAPPAEIHERLHRAIFSVHEALSHRVNL